MPSSIVSCERVDFVDDNHLHGAKEEEAVCSFGNQ
jgi:hypothetical protein